MMSKGKKGWRSLSLKGRVFRDWVVRLVYEVEASRFPSSSGVVMGKNLASVKILYPAQKLTSIRRREHGIINIWR